MATLTEQASKLLDFSQKLDITLLDNVVGCMYTGIGDQVPYSCFTNISLFWMSFNSFSDIYSKESHKKC